MHDAKLSQSKPIGTLSRTFNGVIERSWTFVLLEFDFRSRLQVALVWHPVCGHASRLHTDALHIASIFGPHDFFASLPHQADLLTKAFGLPELSLDPTALINLLVSLFP